MLEGLMVMFLGLAITLWAQFKVKSTFRKYDKFVARSSATADQVARDILRRGGLPVGVEPVHGHLTDHYDPRDRMLRLSESVYGNRSLAAIGVAAHEAGHAFQHAQGYVPLSLRTSLVPIANIGSKLSWIFIIAGFLLSVYKMTGKLKQLVGIGFCILPWGITVGVQSRYKSSKMRSNRHF